MKYKHYKNVFNKSSFMIKKSNVQKTVKMDIDTSNYDESNKNDIENMNELIISLIIKIKLI